MVSYSTWLRVGAIVFGGALVAIDGRATVLQAISNGWSGDTVILIAAAVAISALAPTYIFAAYRSGNRAAAGLLGCAFVLAAMASVSLTMQRVNAQFDSQHHAVERINHPIVAAEKRISRHREELARLDSELRVADAQLAKHEAAMQREQATGRGAAWRDARELREQAAANALSLRNSRAEIASMIASREQQSDALGPVRANSRTDVNTVVVYAAALFALPASIGLFLFGFSARRDVDSDVIAIRANSRTDANNDVVDATANSRTDVNNDVNNDVVRDMLAAAHRHGKLPTWAECKRRFVKSDGTQYAAATITKYRNAAAARWGAMQHNTAAN